jgi:quercetin dioxygenase-like cupin family protein
MKKRKLTEMKRGWFIGDFDPSILRTDQFEVGLLTHKKGEHWAKHYHAIATEYNLLISGEMTIHNEKLIPGDIFIIEPDEVVDPTFQEDSVVVCIKIPSLTTDKYEVL